MTIEVSVASLTVEPKYAKDTVTTTAPDGNLESLFAALKNPIDDNDFSMFRAFHMDQHPKKLNLSIGMYRTEEGTPLMLDIVRKAEELVVADRSRNKEYQFMSGHPRFTQLAAKLVLGADSRAIAQKRALSIQSLSATGALRLGSEFLGKHYGGKKIIYVPSITWGTHFLIFSAAGLETRTYRYFDPATRGIDYEGMLEDLRAAENGAVVLLHGCAHNPTGVDPTEGQWGEILHVIQKEKHLLPFFDMAYQGFASGDLEADAWAVRKFVNEGSEAFIAHSFAKNMGLYGERVGTLTIITKDEALTRIVENHLHIVIRSMYLSPPSHGPSVVATILGDSSLFEEWKVELKTMSDRVVSMRHELFDALKARGTPGDWTFILKQCGMFVYTCLIWKQVDFLRNEYHIYLSRDGRITVAALNTRVMPYVADALHRAVVECT